MGVIFVICVLCAAGSTPDPVYVTEIRHALQKYATNKSKLMPTGVMCSAQRGVLPESCDCWDTDGRALEKKNKQGSEPS